MALANQMEAEGEALPVLRAVGDESDMGCSSVPLSASAVAPWEGEAMVTSAQGPDRQSYIRHQHKSLIEEMEHIVLERVPQRRDRAKTSVETVDLRIVNPQWLDLAGLDLRGALWPPGYRVWKFGPFGSRDDELVLKIGADHWHEVKTGCFIGTLEDFEQEVERKSPGENKTEYLLLIPLLRGLIHLHGGA